MLPAGASDSEEQLAEYERQESGLGPGLQGEDDEGAMSSDGEDVSIALLCRCCRRCCCCCWSLNWLAQPPVVPLRCFLLRTALVQTEDGC